MMNHRNKWQIVLFSALAVLFWSFSFTGCDRSEHAHPQLKLLCGGAIRPPVQGTEEGKGIIESFQDMHPDIRIETSFGASNLLLGQLKLAQSGDLFLPGDDFYIEEARKADLIHETRTIAWFVPVIMVQEGNPLGIKNVSDLSAPDVRLAVADPRAAAVGRITPEIFLKNGVDYEEIDNIEFTGITAPEIAQAVDLGHADATIVWHPTARQYSGSEIIEIEPEKNVTSPLVIAVLETSDNKEAALQFAEFISGEEGRRIFEQYSYEVDLSD